MFARKTAFATATAVALAMGVGSVQAQDPVKIGVLATLEGVFAASGQDGMRGATMAFEQFGHKVGGREIKVITASSDASPDSALRAARRLVENDKVDILIGPLSGSEGIAIKNFAKEHPGVTFLNGSSAAQQTTLENPSENFFRFSTEGVQWQAGLGNYAFKEKGYKRVALIAEDYSFPYSLAMGFMSEFCAAGGKVPAKAWVPLGSKDYSSVIARLPRDVDALYVALGGSDALNFLDQYQQMGGNKPMIAGSITVDQTVLSAKGRARDYIIGTVTAGPVADNLDGAAWRQFQETYRKRFPDGARSPGLFAHAYYVNTLAALTALDKVKGNLSDGHKAFRSALQTLELDTPTGKVKIDKNRQAIADIFVMEVAKDDKGNLYNKVVNVVSGVNQTLGFPPEQFLKNGFASRDNPACP